LLHGFYDRAFVPLDCENCAVIDRAYSKKVCVCVLFVMF